MQYPLGDRLKSSVAAFLLMLMLAVLAGAAARTAYAAPPPPPGSQQQARPVTAPAKKEPGQSLIPVTPSGPAPTGFVITGTPLVAQLKWNAAPGAASYSVWRAAGPAAPTAVAQGLHTTQLANVVPDPRPVYQYRLIVNYSNGTFGETVANWTSPPLAQPSGLQATLIGPQTVQLRWNAAAGAVGYRVDGAGIANTGLSVTATSAVIANVPLGAQSWQLLALYPGNFGDYNNRPGVSLVIRAVPPHAPAWLSKNNGAGSNAQAVAHYRIWFGNFRDPFWPDGPIDYYDVNSNTVRLALQGAGFDVSQLDQWGDFGGLEYTNRTELGAERMTECFEVTGPRTICWTKSHSPYTDAVSVISTDARGTLFGSFKWLSDYSSQRSRDWTRLYLASKTANFDSEGAKFLPHACIACHGGHYDAATGLVVGATLLPIDRGLVYAPRAGEEIRTINALILRSHPTPAVAAYINGLYGGAVNTPGNAGAAQYVPPAWTQHTSIYLGIVKPNCAMCHLAQTNLTLLSAAHLLQNKALAYTAVCGAKSMPHAEVPFMNFWTSNTGPIFMPGVFSNWLGYSTCP